MSSTPNEPAAVSETRASARWLTALRTASYDLRRLVDGLSEEELSRPSFADDWTVAQVLSHLGSGAEICAELVRRGLSGSDRGPQREELLPVWERWNAMAPTEQREQWRSADRAHIELLESVTAEQEQTLLVPYFAGPMDLTTYLGYRLSEHAVHGWDVASVFDADAVVGQLDLAWERIDLIATRFHDPAARDSLAPRAIEVKHGGRRDRLDIREEIHLVAGDPTGTTAEPTATATGTTDVLTRLVYGRHRAGDQLDVTGSVTRADLVRLFPGF
jgi:uncharacterized protein (TIGR03083 family)